MPQFTPRLTFYEFQQVFPDEESCLKYLMESKWKNGFKCTRCGNHKYCKGRTPFHYQCTRCKYQHSPTSHTVFHSVRFPLNKAFYIVFFMHKRSKRVTSTELSQKLGLRQKTCWFFQEKIRSKLTQKGHERLHKIMNDAEKYAKQRHVHDREKQPLKINLHPAKNPEMPADKQEKPAAKLISDK